MKYLSDSIEKTYALAASIEKELKGGEVILLNGELGAGKTAFTKGLARALGVNKTVSSPTFTILRTYTEGRLSLYHFDMYRITSEDELYELGFDDYLYGQGVCVIEWNKFQKLPENVIKINIRVLSLTEREFEVIK